MNVRTLELILASLPVITWVTDVNLEITWAGGGAIRTLGLDRVFPRGASFRHIVAAGHPLLVAHESALAGEPCDVDLDWMERSYHTIVQPLRNDAGEVTGCVGTAYDITELKRAERTIVWQSAFDPLTGALNRTRFVEVVEMLLLHAGRANERLTIMRIDLDDFNTVNASFGQVMGDEILRTCAERIASAAPERAVIGRVEGDELAIVLTESTPERISAVCEQIHARIAEPFQVNGRDLHLNVSLGASTFPFDGDSAEQLLRCAKEAGRRAHQLGGGRSQLFFPALRIDSIQQMELDQSLRRALEREEFFLVYQPQINLASGSVDGLEVLLRWRKDGDVLPAWSFITRLEESALMVPVGRWVIDRALAQLKAWRAEGFDPGRLAINVGARQLGDESFISGLRSSLCLHSIPPESIDVEITETVAMSNVEMSEHILEELRDLGTEISIDDFGTGYSSLNYLKRFTITGLKIDRSFIADLPESRRGAAIVGAMISTAQALDLRLVAEGVETEAQAEWLRNAGCPAAQGFLFSRPLPADEVAGFLRQWKANR